MASIEIDDIGPITHFDYELRGHGVHVLRGKNGCGKSTIERVVQLITDGATDVRPTKRDGAKRGSAEVCGKVLRITEKQSRFDGELQIEGLENLSIADLHSPKFETVVTRDRHRIKTLCRIAGAGADITEFHYLLGGREKFEEIIPRDSMKTDDVVKMSQMVKSAIEVKGREIEQLKSNAESDALAQSTIAKWVDTAQPHDESLLQQVWLKASQDYGALQEKRRAYRAGVKAAEEAREKLKELPAGKSVAEARAELEMARDARQEAADADHQAFDAIQSLEQLLREAKLARETTKAKFDAADRAEISAQEALTAANQAVETRGALDAAIEAAGMLTETTEEEVDNAAEAVGRAKDAAALGLRIRQAIEAEQKAKTLLAKVNELRAQAERLRDAAADVQDVLTAAIGKLPNCPLKIKIDSNGDPRLITETPRSPETPFDDLSDGEKWLIVVGLAVSKNRMIVLSQGAWGELSGESQAKLHEAAMACECFVLTAKADNGELRGEPYRVESVEAAQ
ncbi:MAG: hypothetical protein ABFD89_17425 [Bryobacteraceae bacterium]